MKKFINLNKNTEKKLKFTRPGRYILYFQNLSGKFEFEIKEKTAVFKIEDSMYEGVIGMFKDKFKEIFNLEIAFEAKQKAEKAEKVEKEEAISE